MKKVFGPKLEGSRERDNGAYGTKTGDRFGRFLILGPRGVILRVLAGNAELDSSVPWDHVSVSTTSRTPFWDEMCFVKDLFFDPDETVIQFHPKKSVYVNNHPHVLHLWRPGDREIQLPPTDAV